MLPIISKFLLHRGDFGVQMRCDRTKCLGLRTFRTSCINATDSICRRARMESQRVGRGRRPRRPATAIKRKSRCGAVAGGRGRPPLPVEGIESLWGKDKGSFFRKAQMHFCSDAQMPRSVKTAPAVLTDRVRVGIDRRKRMWDNLATQRIRRKPCQ